MSRLFSPAPCPQHLPLCFLSWGLLVEAWRRLKAMDHPKCTSGVLHGLEPPPRFQENAQEEETGVEKRAIFLAVQRRAVQGKGRPQAARTDRLGKHPRSMTITFGK